MLITLNKLRTPDTFQEGTHYLCLWLADETSSGPFLATASRLIMAVDSGSMQPGERLSRIQFQIQSF